jgi:hypothetical protein
MSDGLRYRAFGLYSPPFYFSDGFVRSADGKLVANVRLSPREQSPDSRELRDAVGGLVAEALNKKWYDNQTAHSMTVGETIVAATNIVLAELIDSVPLARLLPVVGKIHDLLLKSELPAAPYYSPRHFKDALTWIEQNVSDGYVLVAKALSKTGNIQQIDRSSDGPPCKAGIAWGGPFGYAKCAERGEHSLHRSADGRTTWPNE